jgi:hypothetical protein
MVDFSLLLGKFPHIPPSAKDRRYERPAPLGRCMWASAHSAVPRYRDQVRETIIVVAVIVIVIIIIISRAIA